MGGVDKERLNWEKKKKAVYAAGKGTTGHRAGSWVKHYLGGAVSACLTEWDYSVQAMSGMTERPDQNPNNKPVESLEHNRKQVGGI